MGDIGRENSGKLGRWWKRTMPTWLGGEKSATGGSGGGSTNLGKIGRSENARAIIDELRAAGYSDNAVAAIVGSMQTESGFNPKAANDVAGGHTGLWQWDKNRWPKIRDWIKARDGDPYDVRWQAKAWVAEHDAKPGDPMYDHRRTAAGGAILRSNPSLEDAIHGVRESERFGLGEEGGRAANARRWLPTWTPWGARSGRLRGSVMSRSLQPMMDIGAECLRPLVTRTLQRCTPTIGPRRRTVLLRVGTPQRIIRRRSIQRLQALVTDRRLDDDR